jgi:hypothetical protein
VKKFGFLFIILPLTFALKAQPAGCVFKSPQVTINFGSGDVRDLNNDDVYSYQRVPGSCPQDGYYSLAPRTRGCFSDDWHTLSSDHTGGDADGNMLLVNAGRAGSVFLSTPVTGLKTNTVYELCLWLINLCRPTKKCPYPLLPNLNIRLETPDGKIVASVLTGDVPRVEEPRWSPYRTYFTTPASTSTLMLVMRDNSPSGCGNDFALDDITFRECIKQTSQVTTVPKKAATKQLTAKPPPKKLTTPGERKVKVTPVITQKADTTSTTMTTLLQPQKIPATPMILKTRENALVRRIETEAGEIKMDIYDNGQIDGDSVTIYHNNTLVKSHMRLSEKPITLTITVDPSQPHHEIIMVADNLGTIPPNTSVMIITTATNRYELFISSSEQKNAKVVFDLKK